MRFVKLNRVIRKSQDTINPFGVFSILAIFLAFSGFWLANRPDFSTPGVFGGPTVQAKSLVVPGESLYLNDSLSALVAVPVPRDEESEAALKSIVKDGWNWGKLHLRNAVDIAAPCGEQIFSLAEGIVKRMGSPKLWNDGYGGFVEIKHKDSQGNFYSTRYNHTQENLVEANSYVLQGQVIALVGRTGNVHGPTGCHVHFEVQGARNPFAK